MILLVNEITRGTAYFPPFTPKNYHLTIELAQEILEQWVTEDQASLKDITIQTPNKMVKKILENFIQESIRGIA